MVERLRAVIAAVEQLSESDQEQIAALWEETLRDTLHWHELYQRPGSQAFFEQLRNEFASAERKGGIKNSPDEDWA